MRIQYANRKEIAHPGHVKYEGTPPQIFWGPDYIPSHIEHMLDACLEKKLEIEKAHNLHPNTYIDELETLFLPKVEETYERMAEIDQRLRVDGTSKSPKTDISQYTTPLKMKIKKRLSCYKLNPLQRMFYWFSQLSSWIVRLCKVWLTS